MATTTTNNKLVALSFRQWTKYTVLEQINLAVDDIVKIARVNLMPLDTTATSELINLAEQRLRQLITEDNNSTTYPLLYVLDSYRLGYHVKAVAILEQYLRIRYPLADLPLPSSLY